MAIEAFIADLEKPRPSGWHDDLLDWCKEKVSESRAVMSERYEEWDASHAAFRARVDKTRDDLAAMKRNEPIRQAIPLTFAQVETFVSFLMTLYLQRERLFELVPTGEEDADAAALAEATIARDLRDNVFEMKLYKFLLNVAKYGIGVMKVTWEEKFEEVERVEEADPVSIAGQEIGTAEPVTVVERIKVRAGNKIETISPYSFFPDPNFPLSQMQEGEFVASEIVMTRQSLIDMELRDEVVGVEHIERLPKTVDYGDRRVLRLQKNEDIQRTPDKEGTGPVIITEVQATLIPSKFLIEKEPLGTQDYPVKYKIWYANDNRIISIEPLAQPHGQYSYVVGEFTPDDEEMVSSSLSDNIKPLQDTASWLISSHVANVRKVINNQLIVDGSAIEVSDLLERKNVVRLRNSAQGTDISRAVKQLEVRDVTGAHMGDAKQMYDLAQIVSGISDNAMGQFSPGRRSALEARNVNAGAAMRLKMHGMLLFRGALEPMARMMLKNLKQWLDVETFVEVRGELSDPSEYARFKTVTGRSLMGSYDFEVFDGTLPSERGAQAQALQEFLQFLGANPESIAFLGYDPREIMKEWLMLRGIRNPERFKLDALRQQELQAQMQQYGIGPGSAGGNRGVGNGPAGGASRGTGRPTV